MSPPEKHAALRSVRNIDAVTASLNHDGPSLTASLGPTVTSDFADP